MQFNYASYSNGEERTVVNRHYEAFKEAGDSELQFLTSTATFLVAVTTHADDRDISIATATLRDEKVELLLNARSNDSDIFTCVILHFDTEQYKISDRQEALKWLGIVPRPMSRIMDADLLEYIDEHERTVMS